MKRFLLLALLCVAASGPAIPDFWKKGMVKPRVVSPKVAALPAVTAFVVVPIETNYCQWWTSGPPIYTTGGTWVWVQRCNDIARKPPFFTNVWNGPMPTNYTIDFISTAPRGVNPFYKFTLSFESN